MKGKNNRLTARSKSFSGPAPSHRSQMILARSREVDALNKERIAPEDGSEKTSRKQSRLVKKSQNCGDVAGKST